MYLIVTRVVAYASLIRGCGYGCWPILTLTLADDDFIYSKTTIVKNIQIRIEFPLKLSILFNVKIKMFSDIK